MKILNSISSLILLCMVLACGTAERSLEIPSGLSSISVSPLETKEEEKSWESAKLTILDDSDHEIAVAKIERDDLKLPSGPKFELIVKYGQYKVLLTYFDNTGNTVYETCANEASKLHQVRSPTYSVSVYVCPVGSDEHISSESKVIIKPVLNKETAPNVATLSRSFSWTYCAVGSSADGYKSTQHVLNINVQHSAYSKTTRAFLNTDCTSPNGQPYLNLESVLGTYTTTSYNNSVFQLTINQEKESIFVLKSESKVFVTKYCTKRSPSNQNGCSEIPSTFQKTTAYSVIDQAENNLSSILRAQKAFEVLEPIFQCHADSEGNSYLVKAKNAFDKYKNEKDIMSRADMCASLGQVAFYITAVKDSQKKAILTDAYVNSVKPLWTKGNVCNSQI